MDGRRRKFIAALVLFMLWVAALGVLAVCSGRRPIEHQHRPAAVIPR